MAFTEKQEYKIEVLENGTLQVRRSDIVLKDGTEIGRQYHRHVLTPGSDVSNEVQRVQDVAAVTWTPLVVAAYQASIAPEPEVSTMPVEEEPEASTMPAEEEPEVSTADLESEV